MTEVLTDAWFEAVTGALDGLPDGPGGSGVVEVVISGGDPGRLPTTWVVTDGRLVSIAIADGGTAAEATVPQSRADLEAIIAGDRSPAVAFMRGDLKPEGRSAAVLAWLSAMARPDTRAALQV